MKTSFSIYGIICLGLIIIGCAGSEGVSSSVNEPKDYSQYTSLAQALRSIGGITVSGTGDSPSIIVRGGGDSINGGPAQPLFVVDNVAISTSYSQVNAMVHTPNIESIRVLKGTMATNRYGQEGRGGVILIKMKGD